MVVPEDRRRANRRAARMAGYGKVPVDLGNPPIGPRRPADEVLDRALALHVVVAAAGGLDGDAALRWADALGVALHDDEREYLEDAADGVRVEDAARATAVEALAELLWALGLAGEPPIDEVAGGAASVLPGPGEPVTVDAVLRPLDDLERRHDLLAAMAWALRADGELEIGESPGSVDPYVVRRRHQASAWVLGADW
jgi:hypothetical protein